MLIILWDVKEPTHLSLRVGHVVPGVVVCLLLCIMVGRIKKGPQLLWRSVSLTGKVNKIKIDDIHDRARIRTLSSSAYSISHSFAVLTSKIKFVSPRGHVISSFSFKTIVLKRYSKRHFRAYF